MILTELGLARIVNAAGKMTYLGGTAIDEDVRAAMAEVAAGYVDMSQLSAKVGAIVAEATGAEAGYPVNSAAAGIAIATAACLTGTDALKVRKLPDTSTFAKREIIIQKGHAVDFGAQITQVLRFAGASVVEIGSVNKTDEAELANAINPSTAALVFVVSHHTVQEGMLSLDSCVRLARVYGVPVIVDAAAETDLRKYVAAGADLVIYSGQKAVSAPTSGFICGRRDLIQACRLQEKGLARTMKLSKENMVGLAVALRKYDSAGNEPGEKKEELLLNRLLEELKPLPHLEISVVRDATRPLRRVQIKIDESGLGLTAKEVVALLEQGDPSIRTRNHHVEHGIIQLDLRPLEEADVPAIAQRLHDIVKRGKDNNE